MALMGSLGQSLGVGSAPNQQLGRPVFHRRRWSGEVIAAVFFQHDMEIGAAETERADPGTTRPSTAVYPWSSFGIEKERPFRKRAFWIWFLNESRGQNLVVQGEAGLDQSSDAGRAFAVADHRLD